MTISEYDRHHVPEILLGNQDWFGAMLIRLIAKAQGENFEKLRQAFPGYVEAFLEWDKKTGIYANRKDEL